jgi:hypothetical protein
MRGAAWVTRELNYHIMRNERFNLPGNRPACRSRMPDTPHVRKYYRRVHLAQWGIHLTCKRRPPWHPGVTGGRGPCHGQPELVEDDYWTGSQAARKDAHGLSNGDVPSCDREIAAYRQLCVWETAGNPECRQVWLGPKLVLLVAGDILGITCIGEIRPHRGRMPAP